MYSFTNHKHSFSNSQNSSSTNFVRAKKSRAKIKVSVNFWQPKFKKSWFCHLYLEDCIFDRSGASVTLWLVLPFEVRFLRVTQPVVAKFVSVAFSRWLFRHGFSEQYFEIELSTSPKIAKIAQNPLVTSLFEPNSHWRFSAWKWSPTKFETSFDRVSVTSSKATKSTLLLYIHEVNKVAAKS